MYYIYLVCTKGEHYTDEETVVGVLQVKQFCLDLHVKSEGWLVTCGENERKDLRGKQSRIQDWISTIKLLTLIEIWRISVNESVKVNSFTHSSLWHLPFRRFVFSLHFSHGSGGLMTFISVISSRTTLRHSSNPHPLHQTHIHRWVGRPMPVCVEMKMSLH